MNEKLQIRHRGGQTTAEMYKGIPVHAAPMVHAAVIDLLKVRVGQRGRIADLGAGQGALSQRLHDAGFDVCAIDVSNHLWLSTDVQCVLCDLDGDWSDVRKLGPFDAIVAVEIIEHLENPRDFLRKIISLASDRVVTLIVSTPNPLDTFSCATIFTRGIFNWFSPEHYVGGGHISILPFWLIDKHLEFLGEKPCQWSFYSSFHHPRSVGRIAYSWLTGLRHFLSKTKRHDYFNGETALGVATLRAIN